MLKIQSDWLKLSLELNPLRWSLERLDPGYPSIVGSRIAVAWHAADGSRFGPGHLAEAEATMHSDDDDPHGPVHWIRAEGRFEGSEVTLKVGFGLAEELPLMLIEAELKNGGQQPIRLDSLELVRAGRFQQPWWLRLWHRLTGEAPRADERDTSEVRWDRPDVDLVWFANGWQSWSFAGSLDMRARQTGTRLGPLTSPMYLNPVTGHPAGRAGRTSDMFAVLADRNAGVGVLCGQLAEREAFCSLSMQDKRQGQVALRLQSDLDGAILSPGEAFTVDRVAVQLLPLDGDRPLDGYFSAVARESGARVPQDVPAGWSSWYYFFDNVSEADVMDNLGWLAGRREQLPLDFVQLDDGFQPAVGDWLEVNQRFPHGHRWLVDQIHEQGFRAGLWLAPFIAHPRSAIVRAHPDWLLRTSGGRPVRAGYNWNTFVVALDPTHPGVIDYVQTVVKTAVESWGYRYLKLDFLYAGALPGQRHDPSKTRAQALRHGLRAIRQAAGEECLLAGCGSPLGPAIGLVDTMRIGPDVAPRWRPAYQGIEAFFQREPSLPAARNAMRNTLTRTPMHNRWWLNDPDCLLLRMKDTHLARTEVQFLATVTALSGGALFASDNLPMLSDERARWLRRLLPPLTGRPVVLDWLDRTYPRWLRLDVAGAVGQWHLLAVLNWERAADSVEIRLKDVGLDPELAYDAVDFWNEKLLPPLAEGSRLDVPGHGVRLLRLSTPAGTGPRWLGDTFHISGGSGIGQVRMDANSARIGLKPEYPHVGRAWIRTPGRPMDAAIDHGQLIATPVGDDALELAVEADGAATIVVRWEPE